MCQSRKLVGGNASRVQIPPHPPKANCTHTHKEERTFFVTEEYFGICIYFGTKKNLYDIIKTWNG